jgi:uncharacterized protein (TIGR02301 family)
MISSSQSTETSPDSFRAADVARPQELRQCVRSLDCCLGQIGLVQSKIYQRSRLELARAAAHIGGTMKMRAPAIVVSTVAVLTLGMLTLGTVAAPVPAGAAEVAAPFDPGFARLSEILGTLHYLRGLCGANEGNKWRGEMQSLLDAEAPNGQRRSQFVAHFNKGYRTFQQSYHTCTPAAGLVIRRYLEEGSKIAREVTARYSN